MRRNRPQSEIVRVQLNARVDAKLAWNIREIAADREISVSELVEIVLRDYLDEEW